MQIYFRDRKKWRTWLARNHDKHREAWLVFYKPHADKPSLTYDGAVEEALCYGWIDGLVRRLDEQRYPRKFTPRTNSTKWSESNLKRMKALVKAGLMTDVGLGKLDRNARPTVPPYRRFTSVPGFFRQALAAKPQARKNFANLADSYRRTYLGWICSAKREETRVRRVREAIHLLERNEKLGLK